MSFIQSNPSSNETKNRTEFSAMLDEPTCSKDSKLVMNHCNETKELSFDYGKYFNQPFDSSLGSFDYQPSYATQQMETNTTIDTIHPYAYNYNGESSTRDYNGESFSCFLFSFFFVVAKTEIS